MLQKQSIALVALLVLGLAAVAMSASVERNLASTIDRAFGPDVGCKVCDMCKTVVAQGKDQIPMLKPQLEQLCQLCGSDENAQKCRDFIDSAIERLDKETPEQFCQDMGLCKRDSPKSGSDL